MPSDTQNQWSAPSAHAGPLVSVILPVYNTATYIGETLDAATRQTYANLEIIIVDDGSTDETPVILEARAALDPRIRVIRQENFGVARARNVGLAVARGEFIAILDADDLWEPTKIERQVQRMRDSGESTGLVYCWWVWISENGTVTDQSPHWEVEGKGLESLLEVNFTGNASVPLYRRSSVEAVGGFDESLAAKGGQGCEDWDLALRVAAQYSIAVVREILVGYRRRPQSMSTLRDVMWKSHVLVSRHWKESQQVSATALRRSTQQFALYLSGVAFWSGAYWEACLWALRAFPSMMLFRVAPFALRVILRRANLRRRSVFQVMKPGQPLDLSLIPEPLIPYDRLYAHRMGPSGGPDTRTILHSRPLQIVAMLAAFLCIAGRHSQNDGLWFMGDSPRHASNGLFWWDLLAAQPTAPIDFTVRYYARYPVIAPATYPPLFYLLEGLAFHVFAPSPFVAKMLILAFAMMAGLYLIAWCRRWISPFAGWAGVFLAFTPGFVTWTNAVMLNIPAAALGLALLYHSRRWIESSNKRHMIASLAFLLAVLLTYYASVILIIVAALWLLLFYPRIRFSRRAILTALAAVPLALLPLVISVYMAPTLAGRFLPSGTLLSTPAYWTYYLRVLPRLTGPVLLALGVAGLVAGLAMTRWRKEALYLVTWIGCLLFCHTLLVARDSRYIILVIPALLIATMALLSTFLESKSSWVAAGVLLVSSAAAFGSATRVPIPHVTGFREVAEFLQRAGPHETVLYDGYHDGVFTFYVRASDPRFERRVILGDQIFYHNGPAKTFYWVETSKISSSADVVRILKEQCGCRWIALEAGPQSEWSRSQRQLREALAGPEFERVRSFAISGTDAARVDVYRMLGPVAEVHTIDLKFPTHGDRDFQKVEPITR